MVPPQNGTRACTGCALYVAHVHSILFIPQPDIKRERPAGPSRQKHDWEGNKWRKTADV
jgi:hypothetical protein